ncbi:cupin domain-containing protein [Vreelandella rituensis]|uniref:Cupin n=1 Tax=Vreelandella rituensis TaxID=2282306 RepID=A0A368U7X4_9GAMM|nr:cupin domain-containing protein [Halomonas rituensis]RCV93001.1 cupin [Halomonas rituensis]
MRLNADFSHFASVTPAEYHWVDSPSPGVERMRLDRIGEEVARATSLVRYPPNSHFSPHTHPGGEEILVLEGEFADEHGRYPAGSYLRNPIGTSHTPAVGDSGALIFVKLHQFDPSDTLHFARNCALSPWQPDRQPGVAYKVLHTHKNESVSLERWEAGTKISFTPLKGGLEILVLEGQLNTQDTAGLTHYPSGSWLRWPDDATPTLSAGDDGVVFYVKRGHLRPTLD